MPKPADERDALLRVARIIAPPEALVPTPSRAKTAVLGPIRLLDQHPRLARPCYSLGEVTRLELLSPEAAARIVFLVAGAEKAAMVRSATLVRPSTATPPAGRVRPRGVTQVWLVDRAVVVKLHRDESGKAAPEPPSEPAPGS